MPHTSDVIVVGVGVSPNTDWLIGSGLELRDGVVCRSDLNAGAPLVYAAGDIVRWYNPLFEETMRVEHWTNAAEQGALAATNLLAEATGQRTTPYAKPPFFWSDQYDVGLEYSGHASGDAEVVVRGDVEARAFIAYWLQDGVVRAAMNVGVWDVVENLQRLIAEESPASEEALSAALG